MLPLSLFLSLQQFNFSKWFLNASCVVDIEWKTTSSDSRQAFCLLAACFIDHMTLQSDPSDPSQDTQDQPGILISKAKTINTAL